jgi:hypothetical protein
MDELHSTCLRSPNLENPYWVLPLGLPPTLSDNVSIEKHWPTSVHK